MIKQCTENDEIHLDDIKRSKTSKFYYISEEKVDAFFKNKKTNKILPIEENWIGSVNIKLNFVIILEKPHNFMDLPVCIFLFSIFVHLSL